MTNEGSAGDLQNVNLSPDLQNAHKLLLDELKQQFNTNFYENEQLSYEKTLSDYDIIRTLGVGAFATVFLVRDLNTLQTFALKAVEKEYVVKQKLIKQLLMEKKILVSVEFPFVVNSLFFFKDNIYIYFILPFIEGGEVFTVLRKVGVLHESLAQFYAAQVVLGLEYLHHCSVLHRDIKPENILIEKTGYVKLADYGFSKVLKKNRTWTMCGTPVYIAPEIIRAKGYSYSVDWWALGVLIYELISGYPPFYHANNVKLYEKILEGRFKVPEQMSRECKSLIKHLLHVDPDKRYGSLRSGVYDIKNHVWFSQLNWLSLYQQNLPPPYKPQVKELGEGDGFQQVSEVMLKTSPECQFEAEFAHF